VESDLKSENLRASRRNGAQASEEKKSKKCLTQFLEPTRAGGILENVVSSGFEAMENQFEKRFVFQIQY